MADIFIGGPLLLRRAEFASIVSVIVITAALVLVWRPATAAGWAVFFAAWLWWQRFCASGFATRAVYPRYLHAASESAQPCRGKIFAVTGANSGIGYWSAVQLARLGGSVVITTRKHAVGLSTLAAIARAADLPGGPHDDYKGRLFTTELELGSLSSVRAFPAKLLAISGLPRRADDGRLVLEAFVHNAGAHIGTNAPTTDGLEQNIGCNFVAPVVLTDLLLEAHAHVAVGRFVHVASLAHRVCKDKVALKLKLATEYSAYGEKVKEHGASGAAASEADFAESFYRYGASKLGNLATAVSFAGNPPPCTKAMALPKPLQLSLHPGCIVSEFGKDIPAMRLLEALNLRTTLYQKCLGPLFAKTPVEGSFTTVHCCVAPRAALRDGGYYVDCSLAHPQEMTRPAKDKAFMHEMVAWARAEAHRASVGAE